MSATVETFVANPRSAGSRWALTVLVAVAIFINYRDRGNLATAAPLIKSDLHLTNLQIGLLTLLTSRRTFPRRSPRLGGRSVRRLPRARARFCALVARHGTHRPCGRICGADRSARTPGPQ